MRTENKMQAIDSWCARRTLQTLPHMNALVLRINQSFLNYLRINASREYGRFTGVKLLESTTISVFCTMHIKQAEIRRGMGAKTRYT